MSGLMQKYKESLAQTPGPIRPKDLPKLVVDYRGLIAYAKQKGITPSELTDSEKNQFITKRKDPEQDLTV